LSLLFNFASEYVIRKAQGNQEEFKLNGTYQFLAYADNANTLGENINTKEEETQSCI